MTSHRGNAASIKETNLHGKDYDTGAEAVAGGSTAYWVAQQVTTVGVAAAGAAAC